MKIWTILGASLIAAKCLAQGSLMPIPSNEWIQYNRTHVKESDFRLSMDRSYYQIQIGVGYTNYLVIQYIGDAPSIVITDLTINRGQSCPKKGGNTIPIELKFGATARFGISCDHPVEVTITTNMGQVSLNDL